MHNYTKSYKIILLFIIIFSFILLFIITDAILYLCGINTQKITFPGMYNNNIDQKTIEKFFNIDPYFYDSVNIGKNIIKSKKIAICGLARNVYSISPNFMDKLIQLGIDFKEYKIVIFENDSIDNTRNIIKQYQLYNNNIILLDCCDDGSCDCKLNHIHPKVIGEGSKKRIDKMAYLRNKYLNYIKHNLSDYDYMLVIDIDITGGIYMNGYYSTFSKDWDVITARGLRQIPGTYGYINSIYDPLAYIPYNDTYISGYNKDRYSIHYNELKSFIKYNIGDPLIPVKSSFNGIAIYKIKDILDIEYDSKTRCEHIDFNFKLCNKDKHIYIDPSLILQVGNDYMLEESRLITFFKNIFNSN